MTAPTITDTDRAKARDLVWHEQYCRGWNDMGMPDECDCPAEQAALRIALALAEERRNGYLNGREAWDR